jgi:hypothetical protein
VDVKNVQLADEGREQYEDANMAHESLPEHLSTYVSKLGVD